MQNEKLVEIDRLIEALRAFASARHWEPFHTPRNLMLALTGEIGELAEIFQWMTDQQAENIVEDREKYLHLQEEIADVLLYLVRLSDILKVDLNHAVTDKLAKNAIKYPAP